MPKNEKQKYKRAVIREDGVVFESLVAAAKKMNCHKTAISYSVKNNTECKGFKFAYQKLRKFDQSFILNEIWKTHTVLPIKVSDHGRINNIRITYGSNTSSGYKQLQILKKNYRVHRLVAETFIPNPENLPQVDHIDGDKSNNKISNLRWCTQKQNSNWYHKK